MGADSDDNEEETSEDMPSLDEDEDERGKYEMGIGSERVGSCDYDAKYSESVEKHLASRHRCVGNSYRWTS